MSRWFRFHADAMRNPKVARLTDAQFRLWVELMAVASDNDGHIPALDNLKHILKRRLDHLSKALDDLIRAGLMDPLGDGYEPHNWSKHQYKSDVSTARVHKHRSKRNVSETPPETEADTDTDTEKVEPSGSSPSADAPLSLKELVEGWNDLAGSVGLPKVSVMSDRRKRQANSMLKRYPEVGMWQRAFGTIRGSPFLRGQNDRGWKADFDFLLQDKSFTKLVEGSYGQA